MMKRMFLFLALLGLAPAAVQAQNLLAYQVQTLQDAATAIGNGTAIESRGASAVSVQVTGTFVGTVTFQGTIDGANWIALEATNANDDSRATTATAPGIYSIVLHGCVQFRARISAYTSGSITVKGRLGQGMITRNAGGSTGPWSLLNGADASVDDNGGDLTVRAGDGAGVNSVGGNLTIRAGHGDDGNGRIKFPDFALAGYALMGIANTGEALPLAMTGGSVTVSGGSAVRLINDNSSPQGTAFYGTDKTGAKGWWGLDEIEARSDDVPAIKVKPNSDSYTAAPFEIAGNPSGVRFLFAPLYGDSRQLAHMTMLGDATAPSPTIAIKSSNGAGNETENPTVSVFNSSFHGPILAAIGPGFSGSNLLSISDSSYLFSAGATGGMTIMATGSGAPIRFATGGIGTGNERFKIGSDGAMIYPATVTAGGTTGAQTINKVSGTVNFAAGASSLIVTNSLVTANSLVFCTVRTNDSTAVIKNVVPTSGSFTIRLSATATAETSVGFFVINQ